MAGPSAKPRHPRQIYPLQHTAANAAQQVQNWGTATASAWLSTWLATSIPCFLPLGQACVACEKKMPLLRPGILSPALVHSTLTPNQTCTKLDRGTGYCGGQAGACCGHAMCPHTRFLPLVCRCSGGGSQLGAASQPAGSSPLITRK